MRRPLMFILSALIAGIFAGSFFHVHPAIFLLLSAPLIIGLIPAYRFRNHTIVPVALTLSLVFLSGAFHIHQRYYLLEPATDIARFADQGKIVLEGTVIENPIVYPEKNVLMVRCQRLIKEKSYWPVSGTIRLTVPEDAIFSYGDFIRFQTPVRKIRNFNNPGRFDYERLMNLQGVCVSGFINKRSDIVLIRQKAEGGLNSTLESFRSRLKEIIDKNSSSPEKEIIEAMMLGNKRSVPDDIRDIFGKTGTSHILAISGLHVGMVAASAFFLFCWIFKSSEALMLRFNIIKLATAAAFIIVLIYAGIAGMGVTVTRATLMALVFLIALLSGKQQDVYSTLAFAGLIVLALSPEALFDVSFQLSFASVLAILYMIPRFSPMGQKQISNLPSGLHKITRYFYLTILVCAAATIGTLPLIMYYFNRVSLITVLANLIAVPILGTVTLALLMSSMLSAFFSATVAGYIIQCASFFIQASIFAMEKLASLPGASLAVGKPHIIEIMMFYFFVFLTLWFFDEKRKMNGNNGFSKARFTAVKILLGLSVLFFAADAAYFALKNRFSSELKITVLDVGQGNSTLVEFPGGPTMLIDGGGFAQSSFDTGKSILGPALYHKRIGRIDTIVLSHPHPDHLLGLIHVMDTFRIGQVWIADLPIDRQTFPRWHEAIHTHKIAVSRISRQSPEIMINGVTIKILWPPDHIPGNHNRLSPDDVNDLSLVVKITFGHISFLVPGDISAGIEKKLVASGADLKSDALIVPHHGSRFSSTPEFIKAVDCRHAVVSAGHSNVFRHPHPSVIDRYLRHGATVFRTDRDGAIFFSTDGNALRSDTFLQKKQIFD